MGIPDRTPPIPGIIDMNGAQQLERRRVRYVRRPGISFGLAVLLCAVSLYGGLARAQEPSSVEQALQQLQQALSEDTSLDPNTKEALRSLVDALQRERAANRLGEPPRTVSEEELAQAVGHYIEDHEKTHLPTAWELAKERLNVYGDYRLRNEFDTRRDLAKDRYRARIRLRFGANYQMTDTLQFGGRIITGNSDDPNSAHQTLGTVFNSFEISLDRAFLTWRPEWARNGWATVGKFSHPFYTNPVYGELVWDADIQPEGVAVGYRITDRGRLEQFDIVLGEYIVLEQGMADDAYATVVQASARLRLTDNLKANFAVGYYYYNDVTPDSSLVILTRDNAGNAVVDRDFNGIIDGYASEFEIVNSIIALTYHGWRWPLTLSGEYIHNFGAEISEDEGWALGLSLGNSKKKGDWKLYYQWQVIQQDALFSAVAQDDFLLATNHRTHLFGMKYQLTDKIQVHTWAMASQRDRTHHFWTGQTDQTQWRLRTDLNVSF